MQLDVIIPTYNRAQMVQRTLASLLAARVPEGLGVRVAVVDNNSKDATREAVAAWAARFEGRLTYVFETRQGRSPAINAGVAATGGELVGMIDDDEEVAPDWFEQIFKAFAPGEVDYIGGKCLPRWETEPPAWLPGEYRGVIGWVDGGDEPRAYGRDYPGILTGGNAVIRRATLERIGGYSNALGRTDKGLLSCEDEEMYQRLLDAGARGRYVPGLVIYHFVPRERMTKSYYRRWCFWRGVSMGVLDRARPAPVPYLWGVPRYFYGRAARAALSRAKAAFGARADAPKKFANELAVLDLAGYFYGKHFYKAARAKGGGAENVNGAGSHAGRAASAAGEKTA